MAEAHCAVKTIRVYLMLMNIAIIIPARYGSTRFLGKPLAMIGDKSMIAHCIDTAKNVAKNVRSASVSIHVATDDNRIADHVRQGMGANVIMTGNGCETGSDRVFQAISHIHPAPDFVVNLQGDAPFTPIKIIADLIQTYIDNPDKTVITPVVSLSWDDFDRLRANKKTTPFSGTTAIIDSSGRALWFSKNIIPAMRKEQTMRENNEACPVLQHIGLYGYTPQALEKFCALAPSHYEQLEGLEQLRFIENGIPIHTYKVSDKNAAIQSGVDTREDLERVIKARS